jgi:hypothetical protein
VLDDVDHQLASKDDVGSVEVGSGTEGRYDVLAKGCTSWLVLRRLTEGVKEGVLIFVFASKLQLVQNYEDNDALKNGVLCMGCYSAR